jgi:hypothetical protein
MDSWGSWHPSAGSKGCGARQRSRSLPFEVEETRQVSADVLGRLPAREYPHVAEVITEIMRSGREEDFEFGLDLILDGLERALAQG